MCIFVKNLFNRVTDNKKISLSKNKLYPASCIEILTGSVCLSEFDRVHMVDEINDSMSVTKFIVVPKQNRSTLNF